MKIISYTKINKLKKIKKKEIYIYRNYFENSLGSKI